MNESPKSKNISVSSEVKNTSSTMPEFPQSEAIPDIVDDALDIPPVSPSNVHRGHRIHTGFSAYRSARNERKAIETWRELNTIETVPTTALWLRRAFVPLLVVLFIAIYILLGALFYSLLEDDSFADSCYWAVVTLSTVGYGDISPETTGGKFFFCGYIFIGLTVLVSAMAVVADDVQSMALEVSGGKLEPLPSIRRIALDVLTACAVLIVLIAIGCVGFHWTANIGFVESFYFTIETLTTVGYGDYQLDLDEVTRRIFVMVYIFIGVPIFAVRLGILVESVSKYLQLRRIRELEQCGVTRQMLQEADLDMDGTVNRAEFSLYFLVQMSIIDINLVSAVNNMFDKFDVDGDGVLDVVDIRLPLNAEEAKKVIDQAKKDKGKRILSKASKLLNNESPSPSGDSTPQQEHDSVEMGEIYSKD
eukprot:CFRG3115T1